MTRPRSRTVKTPIDSDSETKVHLTCYLSAAEKRVFVSGLMLSGWKYAAWSRLIIRAKIEGKTVEIHGDELRVDGVVIPPQ